MFSQEEDIDIEGVEFNVLRAFHHELRVDALAWSPESHLDRIPNIRSHITVINILILSERRYCNKLCN